jgi:DNA-binding GntR family transcriptional regulator
MSRFQFGEDVKVKRVSATDQVARSLRTMIADGRLPQGEKLPEIPLAEALGVSRNTVRDGIRVLASEGLVDYAWNRGAIVRVLSAADVSDIYELRRRFELEGLAHVADAAPAVRVQAIETLNACAEALDRDDYTDFVEHELVFHGVLVAHLGSPRLDRFFGQLIGELRLLFSDLSSDSEPYRARELLDRYRSLYANAEHGDVETAQQLLKEHLDAYEARLREVATSRAQQRAGQNVVSTASARRR